MLKGLLFTVTKGSGMGLVHSSSVADASFAADFERNLSHDLVRAGIAFYSRFRDDLFLIVRDRHAFREWFWTWSVQAPYFELEVEEYSSTTVRMLQVSITAENGRLSIAPVLKATSLGIPLMLGSAHPQHILLYWPVALIQAFARLASD